MPTLYPGHIDFDYHTERLINARQRHQQYPCDKHLSEVAREEQIFEESGMCILKIPRPS